MQRTDIVGNLLIWLMVANGCIGAPPTSREKAAPKVLFQEPQVFLTISPESGYKSVGGQVVLLDRMLEMHWDNFQHSPNDAIGLFPVNPMGMNASSIDDNVLELHQVSSGSGNIKTSVRYDRIPLNASMDRCLGFWVAYLRRDNEIPAVTSDCLSIHPTWMNDLKNEISNVPLRSLMIPGTHNAGSWIYYQGWPSEGVLIEYTYCHEDTIYDQLINGIRSLDIRVGFYPNEDERFFINHDAVRIRPLRTVLEDVKKFVEETNELVFLDFHRFPVGFNGPQVHHELVTFIQSILGDRLVPKHLTLSATPQSLWDTNRNVLIFYSDVVASEYDVLWDGIRQAWGDTNQLDELDTYLESAIGDEGCRGNAWSLMAQLTSTVNDIILRPTFGIRGYANIANNPVSKWFQRESWYSKSMIVALDFYRGTNLIETAIAVNKNMGNVCL